jgi:hypothetical protein
VRLKIHIALLLAFMVIGEFFLLIAVLSIIEIRRSLDEGRTV